MNIVKLSICLICMRNMNINKMLKLLALNQSSRKNVDFWNTEVNANSFIFNLLNVGMQFLLKNF